MHQNKITEVAAQSCDRPAQHHSYKQS